MARLPAIAVTVRLKLGLLLAGTLAVAVLAVGGALLRVTRQAIEGEVLQRGHVMARNLVKTAKEGLLFDDDLMLHSHLAELGREEGIVGAQVFDEKGVLRAATALGAATEGAAAPARPPTSRPTRAAGVAARPAARPAVRPPEPGGVPTGDGPGEAVEVSVVREPDGFLLTAPVVVRGIRIGEIRLRLAPRTAVERATARSRGAALVVLSGLVLVGTAVAFVAGRRFVRPVERLADGVALAATGDLTREVPVTTRDEIGALTRNFNGMLRSLREHESLRREKAQLTEAFRRYVSRDVADEVLREPEALELGGQVRQVTVLFADIRNFTALAETMSARDVVNILNKYFQIMADAIFAHGGTLDKFMGDCVMAVYGAPVQHPDHVSRAVWTSIDIQRAIDEENARRLAWGRFQPVRVGIGIDSGEAVVGNIGARDRMDYTAIGDPVNTAARLQALTPGGEIYVTGAVFERIEHEVAATPLTPVRLRGKETPVPVFRVEGPRGGAVRAPDRPESALAGSPAAVGGGLPRGA